VGTARGCRERFAADRVAWADGRPFEPGPVFDAGLEVPPPALAYSHRDEAEALAIGRSGTVLVSALVRPATVAAIDPEAAAELARVARPDELVWYVRGLETVYGPGRFPAGDYPARVRWVVVDGTTGHPLAGDVDGSPAGGPRSSAGRSWTRPPVWCSPRATTPPASPRPGTPPVRPRS
jgi:hypothetical protein